MKLRNFRLRASTLFATAAVTALAGCGLPTDTREPRFWEGELEAVQGASIELSGPAAMVVNSSDTRATVAAEVLIPDALDLAWVVKEGACGEDGMRIAPADAFPDLRLTGGAWTANALILRRLDRLSGSFAAEIFEGDVETGELLACADLLPVDQPSGF